MRPKPLNRRDVSPTNEMMLSFVIPAHNEERLLASTIRASHIAALGEDYEVLLVDDDSSDRTANIAMGTFAARHEMIDSRNPALLIIDVQKAIDDPSWGLRNNPRAEENIGALLKFWRRANLPVIHVRHLSLEPGSTYRPGQEGCEFKDGVLPVDGEVVVTKHSNSAFIGTALDTTLRARGISTLVICGVIANNSVEATARMAGNLGFKTYVVSDATATFDKRDFNGHLRSAEDVHAMSLANLDGEYATVLSTEQVRRTFDAQDRS